MIAAILYRSGYPLSVSSTDCLLPEVRQYCLELTQLRERAIPENLSSFEVEDGEEQETHELYLLKQLALQKRFPEVLFSESLVRNGTRIMKEDFALSLLIRNCRISETFAISLLNVLVAASFQEPMRPNIFKVAPELVYTQEMAFRTHSWVRQVITTDQRRKTMILGIRAMFLLCTQSNFLVNETMDYLHHVVEGKCHNRVKAESICLLSRILQLVSFSYLRINLDLIHEFVLTCLRRKRLTFEILLILAQCVKASHSVETHLSKHWKIYSVAMDVKSRSTLPLALTLAQRFNCTNNIEASVHALTILANVTRNFADERLYEEVVLIFQYLGFQMKEVHELHGMVCRKLQNEISSTELVENRILLYRVLSEMSKFAPNSISSCIEELSMKGFELGFVTPMFRSNLLLDHTFIPSQILQMMQGWCKECDMISLYKAIRIALRHGHPEVSIQFLFSLRDRLLRERSLLAASLHLENMMQIAKTNLAVVEFCDRWTLNKPGSILDSKTFLSSCASSLGTLKIDKKYKQTRILIERKRKLWNLLSMCEKFNLSVDISRHVLCLLREMICADRVFRFYMSRFQFETTRMLLSGKTENVMTSTEAINAMRIEALTHNSIF